jgi:ABC-type sugar transport system ATPase subunit
MDEPTTALTYEEVQILFEQIRNLAAQGVGFIYVSHRLAEVFEIADRLTVLREGKRTGSWDRGVANERAVVNAIIGEERELVEEHRGDVANQAGPVLLSLREWRVGDAVRGVDLDVHRGEVLGLAGLAGSGAEEAVGAIFAAPVPTGGRMTLDGREVRPRHPADAKQAGVALVPKDRHAQALLPGFSIRENISVASTRLFRTDALVRWLRRGREEQEARRIVGEMRIKAPSTATHVDALSGGNQQKCVIGRWFTRPYAVYLFVDPCAGVDIHSKAEIYELIRKAADQGSAVLFTSTEVEEYARVCDRTVVFREGVIVGELHGEQVNENDIMRLSLSGQGREATLSGGDPA